MKRRRRRIKRRRRTRRRGRRREFNVSRVLVLNNPPAVTSNGASCPGR